MDKYLLCFLLNNVYIRNQIFNQVYQLNRNLVKNQWRQALKSNSNVKEFVVLRWEDMIRNPIQLVNHRYYSELKRFYLTVRNLNWRVERYCTDFSFENKYFKHSDLYSILMHIARLNDVELFDHVVETLSFLSFDYITIKRSHFDFGELLALAAQSNSLEIVKYIIRAHRYTRRIDLTDQDYFKALSRSPLSKNYELFLLLTEYVNFPEPNHHNFERNLSNHHIILECYINAMRSGQIECVKWLLAQTKWNPFNSVKDIAQLRMYAGESGSFEMMKWLKESFNMSFFSKRFIDHCLKIKRLDIIEWIYQCEFETLEKDNPINTLLGSNMFIRIGFYLDIALHYRYLDGILFLFEKGAPFGSRIWTQVAKCGDQPTANWLIGIEPIDIEHPIDVAASIGNLEMVKWMNQTCPEGLSDDGIEKTIIGGHLETLEWIYENKTERCLNVKAINAAVSYNRMEIIEWFKLNDRELFNQCPSFVAVKNAIHSYSFEMVRFVHSNYPEYINGLSEAELNESLVLLVEYDQLDLFLIYRDRLGERSNLVQAIRASRHGGSYSVAIHHLDIADREIELSNIWFRAINSNDLQMIELLAERFGKTNADLPHYFISYINDIKVLDYMIDNYHLLFRCKLSWDIFVIMLYKGKQYHMVAHFLERVGCSYFYKGEEYKLGKHSVLIFKLYNTHRTRAIKRLKEAAFMNNQYIDK
ncbi:hypothetical protein PPL_02811 [Heterostelium album PN500]|uniref:Ankyrin repeat-containing protein n=1 Tax=Heterostelium pallidum (strain ATCC 26659 / Pp 5 / PN500) TaxID=670386 RepID=D3B346_HETP5|nr:hypothetical protein PPL_02811 [Heterostelium album PN500]EFA83744.1 hypothetical protein PPL_02811 [Heterostelium album PN500]|eukprot:XP_020435861.1 hypothetical protein PPL_02811 [Heterostelium album PN500]